MPRRNRRHRLRRHPRVTVEASAVSYDALAQRLVDAGLRSPQILGHIRPGERPPTATQPNERSTT